MYVVINVSVILALMLATVFFNANKKSRIYLIGYLLLVGLLVTSMVENSNIRDFSNVFNYPLTIYLLGYSVLLFVISLTNIAIGSYLFIMIGVLLTVANGVKNVSTGLPIVWADFQNNLLKEVVWEMTIKPHFILVLVTVSVIVLCGWLYNKFWRYKQLSLELRVTGLCISVVVSASCLLYINHSTSYATQRTSENQNSGAVEYFIESMNPEIMPRPTDYSEIVMKDLVLKYNAKYPIEKIAVPVKKEKIIYILSESLIDPTKFPDTKWTEDPLPTIHKLQEKFGGSMYSPVFGGGTVNVEFSLLSGFDYNFLQKNSIAYNHILEKNDHNIGIPFFLKKQGYETKGVHSHLKKGYQRNEVYKKLGFDSFISRETMIAESKELPIYYDEGYISDMSFVDRILLEVNKNDKSTFINSVSMQNHYPYTEATKGKLKQEDNLLENYQDIVDGDQLALYARGVKKMDTTIDLLIQKLTELDQPTTVVFYGDHGPALNQSLYDNAFFKDDKQLQKYLTPYFVWNNKINGEQKPKIINPGFLGSLAFSEMSVAQAPFYQFEHDLMQKLPAYNIAKNLFLNSKGEKIALTAPLKEALHDYQLFQYDMFVGEGYSKELFSI